MQHFATVCGKLLRKQYPDANRRAMAAHQTGSPAWAITEWLFLNRFPKSTWLTWVALCDRISKTRPVFAVLLGTVTRRDGMDSPRLFVDPHFSIRHSVTSFGVAPHAHFEHVIGYFFNGRSQCRIGSRMLEFRAGDLGLLNPGEAHEDLASPEDRDYMTVGIKEDFLQEMLRDIGSERSELPCFLVPQLQADLYVQRICEAIRSENDTLRFGRDVLLRNLVMELVIHVLRHFMPSDEGEVLSSDLPALRWPVRRAMEYLHDTYTQDFNLERVSAAAQLSKYHLERVFKKATGLRLHSYMVMLRVERAKELLIRTSRPIADIALELGFADQSHFSNVFKQVTGLSPRGYRMAANSNSKQS